MAQIRERYHFIHNVFANFYKDMLDYFSLCLYPRFEYRVMGTYDKAVEYLNKQCDYGRETDKPILPALILNPTGEFLPADANAGGRFSWRYPNLSPTLTKRLFDPIYQDANLVVNAGFIRIKGEIELIMMLNSFYEYCDLRMLFINMFGGLDRIIYPRFFTSFIIIPESFLSYTYNNPVTGLKYKIKWSEANATNQLVRSTARNELVLPLRIKPEIVLTSLTDASNRYGGTDKLAEWRLGATVNYELEIPNYLVLESDYLAEDINVEIQYGSTYSSYSSYDVPVNRQLSLVDCDWGYDETSNSLIVNQTSSDATCDISFIGDFVFNTRYFHIVTEAEVNDTTSNLLISIPERITDPKTLIVNSKYGRLNFGDHYRIIDNGWTLEIRSADVQEIITEECDPTVTQNRLVKLETGMILELFVYERLG